VIILKQLVDLESLLQRDTVCSSKNLARCHCLLDHREEPYVHYTVDFSHFGKNGHAMSKSISLPFCLDSGQSLVDPNKAFGFASAILYCPFSALL